MEDKNPKTAAMEFVGQKVRDMLAAEQIAADSNLIEEGLSSLMIMQIAGGLRKYKLRISFAALIEKPTLRDWAELINKAKIKEAGQAPEGAVERVVEETVEEAAGEAAAAAAERTAVEPGGQFPLTDVQYAYWVGRNDDQPLGGVGCHAYLEFHGQTIDPLRLKLAWNALQRHHPMLRAKFFPNGRQAIMPSPYSEEIEVFELGGLAADELEEGLLSIRSARSHRKLRVEEGEVAGLALALLPDGTGRLFLDVDLLVADVLSLSLIIRDLAEAYLGKKLGEPPEYTFQDYIRGRDGEAENQEREEDKRF
ncbi:MAG: condensation domain-containing protein, partial [Desulfitobacterium hafniense]